MELWKTIPGWAPYEVSSDGRVRRGGKVLKPIQHIHRGTTWAHLT